MMAPIVGAAVVGLALAVWLKFDDVKALASRARWTVLVGAGFLVLGLLVGWWWGRPVALPLEASAPAVRQADGSLVLERKPDQSPPPAAHNIPRGGVEERRVSVVVKPARGVVRTDPPDPAHVPADVSTKQPTLDHVDSCDCPPVTVDLSIVRMPDKGRRVIASSPDGKILSGVDVPIEPQTAPRIPRWTLSAIAVADLDGIRPGALLTRRAGQFVVGGGFITDPGLRRPGAIVQAGVTW